MLLSCGCESKKESNRESSFYLPVQAGVERYDRRSDELPTS